MHCTFGNHDSCEENNETMYTRVAYVHIYIQLLCEAFPTLPPLDRYALLTPHHYVLFHSTMLRYNYPPSHRVFRGWFSRSFDPQSHTQQLTITGSMSHGADNTLYKIEQRYPKVTPLAETGGGA